MTRKGSGVLGAEPDSRPVSLSLILVLVREAGRVATMENSPRRIGRQEEPHTSGAQVSAEGSVGDQSTD